MNLRRLLFREPTIGRSTLTQSDLDRLLDLDSEYRTDYTYGVSKSYRRDGSAKYENPRMSRLPLSYYRRKWAFEEARNGGIVYYVWFCLCDIVNRFLSQPVRTVAGAIRTALLRVVKVLTIFISLISFEERKSETQAVQKRFPSHRRRQSEQSFSWSSDNDQLSLIRTPYTQYAAQSDSEYIVNSNNEANYGYRRFLKKLGRTALYFITLGIYPSSLSELPQTVGVDDENEQNYLEGSGVSFEKDDEYPKKTINDKGEDRLRKRVITSKFEYVELNEKNAKENEMGGKLKRRGQWIRSLLKFLLLPVVFVLTCLNSVKKNVAKLFRTEREEAIYNLRSRNIVAPSSEVEVMPINKVYDHPRNVFGIRTSYFDIAIDTVTSIFAPWIIVLRTFVSIPIIYSCYFLSRIYSNLKRLIPGNYANVYRSESANVGKEEKRLMFNKKEFFKRLLYFLLLILALFLIFFLANRIFGAKLEKEEDQKILFYPTLIFDKTLAEAQKFHQSSVLMLSDFAENVHRFLRVIRTILLEYFHLFAGYIYYLLENVSEWKRTNIAIEETVIDSEQLDSEKRSMINEIVQLKREKEFNEEKYNELRKAVELVQISLKGSEKENPRLNLPEFEENELLNKFELHFNNYITDFKSKTNGALKASLSDLEARIMSKLEELSSKMRGEFSKKLTESQDEETYNQMQFLNELNDLSAVIIKLRKELDKLREEKDAKIKELEEKIALRDTERSEKLVLLKNELGELINDEILKRMDAINKNVDRPSILSDILKEVEHRIAILLENSEKQLIASSGSLSESDTVVIKKMIQAAIKVYDSDKTGKVDYALESSGGSILSTRCTESYKPYTRLESIFGIPVWYSSYSPRIVIEHNTHSLSSGECWAFRGVGYLVIKLSSPIFLTEVSYEHLQVALHPDNVIESAPKEFHVWSLQTLDDEETKYLLGKYQYDNKGEALQFFPIQNHTNTPTPMIELVVQSNWGSSYTCLYRFRVHGRKAD